jgi:hypothetical protein
MLQREEIEQLLRLQSQAYELLMWLADEATRDPNVLSPTAVGALQNPETAARWLTQHQERFPVPLRPAEFGGAFANLFASFFSTSFHVKHLKFEGRLLESRVTVGAPSERGAISGLEYCQILALRHLATAEKRPITEKEARRIVRRAKLHEASLLWTYAWELDRRSKEKGKGSVVHRLWRSIPRETRQALSVEQIWQGREMLLGAVRELGDTSAS